MLLGTVCALVVMIAVLVVSTTVAQAVHQRAPELALLRAVGASPRQLRAAVSREIRAVAAVAAVLGAVGSVPVYFLLSHLLRSRRAVPIGLDLPAPWWMFTAPLLTVGLTVLVAWVSGALACRGIARVRPAQAVSDAGTEPEQPGNGRTVTGIVLLLVGVVAGGTTLLQAGELAAMAASTSAMTLVIGCALLGPWIAKGAIRVLGAPASRLGGAAGHLAAAAARANTRRLGAAITPIVLVVAFAGVQLSAGATLERQGAKQGARAMRADLAVTGPGSGLPDEAVRAVRGVPGIATASGVLHSTVVLAYKEAGDPRLTRLPVMALDPGSLPRTIDPGLAEGDLGTLGRGTVAVGEDRARSRHLKVGSTVKIRYGDGAQVPLKVVAVYERSLALGDFLFAPQELGPHMGAPLYSRALVALEPGADPARVTTAVRERLATTAPGATVETHPEGEHLRSEDRGTGEVISTVAVGVIGGFTVIAVLSTLTLIMLGRLRIEAAAVILTGLVVGKAAALVPLLA